VELANHSINPFVVRSVDIPGERFAALPNASADPIEKDVRYVECGSSNKQINTINGALASLDPSEDNSVYVRGRAMRT